MKHYLLLLTALLICCLTFAQVKTRIFPDEIPARLAPLKSRPGQELNLSIPAEFARLKRSAESNAALLENRFAVAIAQEVDIIKRSTVARVNGQSVYTLTIKAPGALNINCQFSEFKLPDGALLKIFTRREITDSITARENNPYNVWATKVYQGDELHFTLSLPPGDHKNLLLKINNVNIGFRPYGTDFGNIGAAAACHRNVVCPEGAGWEPERNSVALIVANGQEACTGALVMNTCNSNIPYFLTAEHCLDAGNVPNWVFQFQTWSTDCNTNAGWIETVQFNGCQLRAAHEPTDAALLELNATPAPGSNIHYAGWSRELAHNSVTVIHHPAGDLMKISQDFQAPVAVADVLDITRQCWEINQDGGRLEGGSSGAPYFNQDHRIIGQHFRRPQVGTMPTCDITIARGGRFEPSWAGGGTAATRFMDWLDPTNSNAMTTNTTNVANLQPANPGLSIGGPGSICAGSANYQVDGLPAGATVCWSVSNGSIAGVPNPNCVNPITITKQGDGTVTLTATVTLCGGIVRTVNRNIVLGNPWPTGTTFATSNYNYYNGSLLTSFTFMVPGGQSGNAQFNVTDPNYTSHSWTPISVPSSGASWSTSGSSLNISITAPPTAWSSRTCTIRLTMQGPCGQYIQDFSATAVNRGSSFRIAPNPANSQVTVTADKANASAKVQALIYGIKISDQYGVVRKSLQYKQGVQLVNIPTSELSAGIYQLSVFDGKEWRSESLIIQK